MLSDPLVQTAIFPLGIVLAGLGFSHFIASRIQERLAGLWLGIGFLGAYVLIVGTPIFPPVASVQKLFYIVLTGMIISSTFATNASRISIFSSALILIITTLLYLGSSVLAQFTLDTAWRIGILFLASLLILKCTAFHHPQTSAHSAVLLLVASLAATGICILGAAASTAQLYAALGAALGGFCSWNWPKARFGINGLFAAFVTFIGLSTLTVLYSDVNLIGFGCLTGIFVVGLFWEKIIPVRAKNTRWDAVLLAIVSAIPAGIGLAIAWWDTANNVQNGYY